VSEVGTEKVRSWDKLGDEQKYQALLSVFFWGASAAVVVNEFVQEYLSSLWDARQLVIRGQTASNGAGLHGREAIIVQVPHNNVLYMYSGCKWCRPCSESELHVAAGTGRALQPGAGWRVLSWGWLLQVL
jgi:hypothetical protein